MLFMSTATSTVPKSVRNAAEERVAVKAEMEALAKRLADADSTVLGYMTDNDLDKIEVDGVGTISLVQAVTTTYNVDVLKGLLTRRQFSLVTEVRASTPKVREAINLGVIDAETVAPASTEVATRPYLKVTQSK
jgi:Asp/Glu/hydantoin racemase